MLILQKHLKPHPLLKLGSYYSSRVSGLVLTMDFEFSVVRFYECTKIIIQLNTNIILTELGVYEQTRKILT